MYHPNFKNLENLLGHLLYFQKPTNRNDFLKKRQKPLCKDEEPGSCEASVVFLSAQCWVPAQTRAVC